METPVKVRRVVEKGGSLESLPGEKASATQGEEEQNPMDIITPEKVHKKQRTLDWMWSSVPIEERLENEKTKYAALEEALEKIDKEVAKIRSGRFHREDYVDWGKTGGRPKETLEQKIQKKQARLDRLRSQTRENRDAAKQGGSWRQGRGKNVVWTARYKAVVGEFLTEEIKKYPATDAGQEQFWKRMIKEYAEGRDVSKREVAAGVSHVARGGKQGVGRGEPPGSLWSSFSRQDNDWWRWPGAQAWRSRL